MKNPMWRWWKCSLDGWMAVWWEGRHKPNVTSNTYFTFSTCTISFRPRAPSYPHRLFWLKTLHLPLHPFQHLFSKPLPQRPSGYPLPFPVHLLCFPGYKNSFHTINSTPCMLIFSLFFFASALCSSAATSGLRPQVRHSVVVLFAAEGQ